MAEAGRFTACCDNFTDLNLSPLSDQQLRQVFIAGTRRNTGAQPARARLAEAHPVIRVGIDHGCTL